MTSYELIKKIKSLLSNLESKESILNDLQFFSSLFWDFRLTPYTFNLFPTSEEQTELDRRIKEILKEIEEHIRPSALFKKLHILENNLLELGDVLISRKTSALEPQIENFIDIYEDYLNRKSYRDIILFLIESRVLFTNILTLIKTLRIILELSDSERLPEYADKEDEKILTLYLDCSTNLSVISSKILAIEKIYSELAFLLNVSTAEYPLKVVNLEIGSFWLKIFGESKVIALLDDTLRQVAGFLYRNYTNEGKRSVVPIKTKELNELISLKSKMDEMGFDTSNLDENIRKSAQIVAQEYSTLLAEASNVEINGESYYASRNASLFLDNKPSPLLLEDGNESDKEN